MPEGASCCPGGSPGELLCGVRSLRLLPDFPRTPDLSSLISTCCRRSVSGARGFKYGKHECVELNYSSNVKPRSENKVLCKRSCKMAGLWRANRVNAGEFGRLQVGR